MEICEQRENDWTVVLRRQRARIAAGQPGGGYTDMFEVICCDCGDNPDLEFRDVSRRLQLIRGPYPMLIGVLAYEEHIESHNGELL